MPAVPETMRAAAIDRFGGPEVLTLHVLPVPADLARRPARLTGSSPSRAPASKQSPMARCPGPRVRAARPHPVAAKLEVPIAAAFPLAEAARAHECLAAGHVLCKFVLQIR